jgi:hypothetical protein
VTGASAAEMCLSEFAQTADGAFFVELRASEEYAAVGSSTSFFTLQVSPGLVMRCFWFRAELCFSLDSATDAAHCSACLFHTDSVLSQSS